MIRVILKKINDCTSSQQEQLLDVRNHPSVRKFMFTDRKITLDEHQLWLGKLRDDPSQIIFAVLVHDVAVGAVSVNAIDRAHKKSEWGMYLSEKMRGGLGAVLEFKLLDFVFTELELEKLNCEIIETNRNVLRMHEKFGFVNEGMRRSNIIKCGKRIGVVLLGISKNEWLERRPAIFETCKALIGRFDVSIDYASR